MKKYILVMGVIALGAALCAGGLYVGHMDDAPGAGMIGFLLLAASVVAGVKIARRSM